MTAAVANHRLALVLFLVLVAGGGLAIGYLTMPGAWYAQLAKPAFTPPGWIFAPVWTVLYIMITVAGWCAWRRDRRGRPVTAWWTQFVLNFLWPPVFFSAHQIGLALAIILLLLAAILAFIVLSWREDHAAVGLFVPYAAWVAFGTARSSR
ncbi:MAG: tryptophan-rich sensory protein [Alphaproteobacteria bacterium]|nr:tryptophan-rich sensory protein [Alphaproteobacteria bacterium]